MNEQAERPSKTQECELVAIVADFFVSEGYKVRAEVSNLGQSADLVATRGRWVTFIEVKVRDWRSALTQCTAHRLVADYICIALGTKGVSDAARTAAADAGIGLIHAEFGKGCSWIVKPPLNIAMWRPQRRRFSAKLQAVEYVC
jgi:hypothetical protein